MDLHFGLHLKPPTLNLNLHHHYITTFSPVLYRFSAEEGLHTWLKHPDLIHCSSLLALYVTPFEIHTLMLYCVMMNLYICHCFN